MTPAHRPLIGLAIAGLLLAAPGCEPPTLACTQIGCSSGLIVHLGALPVGAFRVEVFANAPGQQPVYAYECDPGADQCTKDVFFPGLIVDHPFVRVTTGLGTVTREILDIRYGSHRPNGPRCGPECRTAELSVAIPG